MSIWIKWWKFTFLSGEGLGWPAINKDGHMVSGANTHFNSFDIYGENVLLNSRDMGTIFSLKLLNEDGTLRNKEDFKLNWVFCGNSITPYYIEEDAEGNNPIKVNEDYDESEGIRYREYIDNPDYNYHLFSEWEDKLLSVIINGETYNFKTIEGAKAFNLLDNDNKFFGEHTIRVINSYLDSVSDTIEGYDPNKLYISIHDNHFPSEGVIYNNNLEITDKPSGIPDVAWGCDAYSYHDDQESTIKVFGDNPYIPEEDYKSFTKVYEIDDEAMTAKMVLNVNNTVPGSDINQFSDYRSSSTFFSINKHSYLVTESSMNSSFSLWQFDGMNFNTGEVINPINPMDIQWTGEAGGYMHYRTYPIFNDMHNSVYGWNALNPDPYMG